MPVSLAKMMLNILPFLTVGIVPYRSADGRQFTSPRFSPTCSQGVVGRAGWLAISMVKPHVANVRSRSIKLYQYQ